MITREFDGATKAVRSLLEAWADRVPGERIDIDAEVALWLVLPSEQRDLVSARLSAFAPLRRSALRGEVGRVAEDLGVGRANGYRLLKRMEAVGPVSGLIPHRRPTGKRSQVRDGFGDPWEAWIKEILLIRPDVAVPTLRKELVRRAEAAVDRVDRQPPEITALRRHINRLRPGAGGAAEPVGGDLLLDLVGLSAVVVSADPLIAVRPLGLTVLLDSPSGLVLGHALIDGKPLSSMSACIGSVSATVEGLARAGASIAQSVGTLCVSPHLVNNWAPWIGAAVPPERRPRISFVRIAGAKGGMMLLRRLGDRFEGFGISRVTLDQAGCLTAEPDPGAATYSSLEDAASAVDMAVSRWNASRLSARTLVGGRGRTASVAKAVRVAEDVRLALLPVTKKWTNSAIRLRELSDIVSREG